MTDKSNLRAVQASDTPPQPTASLNNLKNAAAAVGPGQPSVAAFTPVTVGNPAAASSLAIDQRHLEELVTSSGSQSSVGECRRPPKGIFFTVPAESGEVWKNRAFFYLLELPGRDPYIVHASIAISKEEDVIRPVLLVRFVTMTGDEGLWPLKLNPPDGKANPWNTSALNILELAGTGWVRIVSLKGHYRHQVSKKTFAEVPPRFTNRSFEALVDIAFKDRVVATLDHEIWDELDNGSTK
jgi:hypothetical protein